MDSTPDINGKDIMNHFLVYPIEYKGERQYVVCRVRENSSGRSLYIHGVYSEDNIQKIKEKRPLQTHTTTQERVQRGDVSLYDRIIANFFNQGNGQNADDAKYSIRAWHGNGLAELIDKFRLQFIGTGEGGQAHGYGLYFAKERTVSEGYVERLANRHQVIEMVRPTKVLSGKSISSRE